MGRDLREIIKEEEIETKNQMRNGHQLRFLEKLEEGLPAKKAKVRSFVIWKAAAIFVVGLGMGYVSYVTFGTTDNTSTEVTAEIVEEKQPEQKLTIGSLSPELNKIEKYYIANINLQLKTLPSSKEDKDLLDGYMNRLNELDKNYKILNEELNTQGPNEYTVNALIENLKLRLKLLFELKNKLNKIKNTKNENFTNNSI